MIKDWVKVRMSEDAKGQGHKKIRVKFQGYSHKVQGSLYKNQYPKKLSFFNERRLIALWFNVYLHAPLSLYSTFILTCKFCSLAMAGALIKFSVIPSPPACCFVAR